EQCLVIGDRRKFVSALVVPSLEALETYAHKQGIEFDSREELIENPKIVALFDDEVARAMDGFAQYETVKKVALLPREWTVEDDELTPTLKVKRRVVEARYQAMIDSMYKDAR
ncbi:MAG: long-chain fatty acid--CoA ligase, partial [Fidelibacterota bacterium]